MTNTSAEEQRESVGLLLDQHRQMEDSFRRVADATGDERRRAFHELRTLIATHETVEEMLVHPRMRWLETDGDALALARTHEETEIKRHLLALEGREIDSAEFVDDLEQLRALTLAHNKAEEQEEFPLLAGDLDGRSRRRLRRALAMLEKVAPTRPHPGMALGGENVLGGGFAAVADRVRDLDSRD